MHLAYFSFQAALAREAALKQTQGNRPRIDYAERTIYWTGNPTDEKPVLVEQKPAEPGHCGLGFLKPS